MIRVLIGFLGSLLTSVSTATEYLNLYTWEDYIDPVVLERFEQRYNISVIVTTYADDLERDQQVASSGGEGMDIILLDDSSLNSYIRNGWITPLVTKHIHNDHYLNWSTVPLSEVEKKYAQPYAEGSYGLVYHSGLIKQPINSWGALYNPPPEFKGKIGLAGQPTELLPTVLLYLGYDLWNPTSQQLIEAEALLMKLRPDVTLFSSETPDLAAGFSQGTLAIAPTYNTDFASLQLTNPELRYVIPKEGGFYWLDSLAIAAASHAKVRAHKFLNFLLEPEIAARQMLYINTLISHPVAIELLPKDVREPLEILRAQARNQYRFKDSGIWAMRRIMSTWYSLDTEGSHQ